MKRKRRKVIIRKETGKRVPLHQFQSWLYNGPEPTRVDPKRFMAALRQSATRIPCPS